MYAPHSYTDTLMCINTCSDSHSENSNYRAGTGWGGTRGKVTQGSRALSCASSLETEMTITHSGFQNESLAFPPLLNKKKEPLALFQSRSATKWHGSVLHR